MFFCLSGFLEGSTYSKDSAYQVFFLNLSYIYWLLQNCTKGKY